MSSSDALNIGKIQKRKPLNNKINKNPEKIKRKTICVIFQNLFMINAVKFSKKMRTISEKKKIMTIVNFVLNVNIGLQMKNHLKTCQPKKKI